MSDDRTISVYDSRADEYAAMVTAMPEMTALRSFIAALPPGGSVLDLGCGPGHAASVMQEAGLVPDPVDASARMVDMARDRGVPARQAGFDDIDGQGVYDGVWANFSLLHAARDDMPGHLSRLHRALRPGGRLHLGMKTGIGAHRDALGRFYTFYTIEELKALLSDHGFTVTETRTGAGKGLAGTHDPWCLIAAHA